MLAIGIERYKKSWRKIHWDSVFKGNSAFLIPYLDGIYEMLGLPQAKIEEILASGYTVESILDVDPISELKNKQN